MNEAAAPGAPAHRVLIIDDQEAIHEDYRKILGRGRTSTDLNRAAVELFGDDAAAPIDWEGFELDSAYQGQEGLQFVQRSLAEGRPYAMAFVDIRMPPGWDGIETVRHIWEVDPEILIVICSAYSDYTWEEMIGRLGRSDRFLILKKPFDNIEVRQCAMAMTERWCVARTDVLTGLLNRRAFRSHLDLEWSRSLRHELPLACAMVDLDFFKRVNDTFGHGAGDQVIKSVSQSLRAASRASDSVCRYGGEEICLLLPHTSEQEAAIWAEHARTTIENTPIQIGERTLNITASIGVAERLASADDTDRLMDRADRALLCAKDSGRNRVVQFSQIVRPPTGPLLHAPPKRWPSPRPAPATIDSRARLLEGAQAVAECAAQLPAAISATSGDPLVSMLEGVTHLQELIQELLSRSQTPLPLPIDTPAGWPDAPAAGSASVP